MASIAQNRGTSAERELLTDDERERLEASGGGALIGWARRVRLEQEALDRLLDGDPEPSNVLPFGRRSSAASGRKDGRPTDAMLAAAELMEQGTELPDDPARDAADELLAAGHE